MIDDSSHFAKEKKRLHRSSLHSNPACHAHTHTLTFKMVKMVESADEFKALKMGDKPVRALPGSAPRSRTPMSAERKCCARVFFHTRARVFPSRASRSWAQSSRRHRDRALGVPPRARLSRPTSNARARVPRRPRPGRRRPDRESDGGLNEHDYTRLLFRCFFLVKKLETVFLFFSYDPLIALTSPLIPLIPPVTHKSSWWTSPRLGAARAR